MYCANCGTQNDDSSVFCIGCGAKLNEEPTPVETPAFTPSAPAPKNSKKGLFIAIGAAILAVAIALVLIFTISTPKSVAKKYLEACMDGDGKAYLKVLPKAVVKEDLGDKDDQEDFIEDFEDETDEMCDELDDYYDNWSIDYKITDVDDVKKSELKEIKEYYDDEYDIKVKAAKEVTVKVSVKADGEKDSEEIVVYVIKVGAKWYIEIMGSDDPFVTGYYLIWDL